MSNVTSSASNAKATVTGSALAAKIHTFVATATSNRIATIGAAAALAAKVTAISASSSRLIIRGRALPWSTTPSGAFRDFAHYTVAMPDPAMVLIRGKAAGLATLDNAQPSAMRRVWVNAATPQDYPVSSGYAWRRAAFVSNGIRINAMPANAVEYIDGAQVEVAGNSQSGPSNYSPARSLQVKVNPDRLNYVINGGFNTTLTGWTHAANATPTWDAGRDRLDWATANPATNSFIYPATNIPALPGQVWSFSYDITVPAGYPTVVLRPLVRMYSSASTSIPNTDVAGPNVTIRPGTTVTVSQTSPPFVPTTVGWRPVLQCVSSNGGMVVGSRLYVDNVIAEKSATVGAFFDGDMGTDYLWEQGTTAPQGRSYYYRDRKARAYLLDALLQENCPLGVIPSAAQYATLPSQ